MSPPRPLLASLLIVCLGLAPGPRALQAEEASEPLPRDVAEALAGLASPEREARQAAAEAATRLPHEALLAPLQKAAKDEYRSVREAVFRALATRVGAEEQRKAARTLETRLKELDRRPDSKDELLVVVGALRDLAQESSIDPLLEGLETATEADVARARLEAVACVPSKESVERLIGYAARGRRGGETHRAAALRALELATGVKLGSLDAWHRWWAENKRTFDPQAAARARAEEEARAQAKQDEREARRAKRAPAEKPAEGAPQKPDGKPEEPPAPPPQKDPPADDPPREKDA